MMPATTSTLAELPASPALRRNDRSTEEHAVATPFPPLTRSLRWNMLYALVGNGAYFASQGGFLVILAQFTSPAVVGEFAYGLAVTAPIFMLVNLQLRQLVAIDARNELELSDLLGLRLLTTLVAGILSCIIATLFGETSSAGLAIVGTALFKSVESLSEILNSAHQRAEHFIESTISCLLRAIAGLLLVWAVASVSPTAGNCSFAAAGGALLVLCFYDLPTAAKLLRAEAQTTGIAENRSVVWPKFRGNVLRTIVWRALPLGIVMMLFALLPNIPRYFVHGELGASDLGVYSALGFLGMAGTFIMSATCQPALPRMAKYYLDRQYGHFSLLVAKLVCLGAALGTSLTLGAIVFGAPLLEFLYGPIYSTHQDLLVWQMVAATVSFMAAPIGTAATASRKITMQPFVVALTTVTCGICCWFLVPTLGLQGASLALCLAWCTCLLGNLLLLRLGSDRP